MPLLERLPGEYISKFVRLDEKIYVTEDGDLSLSHQGLLMREKLMDLLRRLSTDPLKLDAGFFAKNLNLALFNSDSSTLRLPKTPKARILTAELYTRKNSGSKAFTDESAYYKALAARK